MISQPTLYFIDDDEDLLFAVSKWSRAYGLTLQAFSSATAFLAADNVQPPGCIVADLKMPGMSGLELLQELNERSEEMPLILISGHADFESAVSAFKRGVVDFFTKPFDSTKLLKRIQQCFDEDQRRIDLETKIEADKNNHRSLTPREKEVFDLLARGRSGKQIASELEISYRTVEKFRAKVMQKMEAASVAELVHAGFRIGYFPDDD